MSNSNGAINGRITEFLIDFKATSEQVNDTAVKVDTLHEKLTGNDGVYDKVNSISGHTRHLEKLPVMASTMKIQAWTNLFLAMVFGVIVVIAIIKGANINFSIPGYIEINSKDSHK